MGCDKRKMGNFLKCASLNVRGLAKTTTLSKVKDFISSNKCNLVFLQELKTTHNSNTVKINWKKEFENFIWCTNDSNKNECGILIHKRIQYQKIIDLKTANFGNQWMTWIIVHCIGKSILVGSYYRSPSERQANNQGTPTQADMTLISKEINEIQEKFKITSIMIAGDMNASSKMWDARFDGHETQATKKVVEFIEENELVICNDRLSPTHAIYEKLNDGIINVKRYNSIDLTLMSYDLIEKCSDWTSNSYNYYDEENTGEDVENYELDIEWLSDVSDHFALTWNINYNIENNTEKWTWRLNSKNWENFRIAMEMNSSIWIDKFIKFEKNKVPIDTMTELLTKMLRDSANATIGVKTYTNNSVSWFTSSIGKTISILRKLKRKREDLITRTKEKTKEFSIIMSKIKKSINYYKRLRNKLIKQSKLDRWHKSADYLNNNIDNQKEFNKRAKKITKAEKATIGPLDRGNGTYATEISEKAQLMHDYFTLKHKQNEYSDENINFHNYVYNIMDNDDEIEPEDLYGNDNQYLHLLNKPITRQEIWKAIKTLKRENAMGPDIIHNVMILEAIEQLLPVFELLFNECLNQGYHPFLWRLSEFVGMPKPGKDSSKVKNLRALQLISTIDRILQKIFTWRLLTYCILNGILLGDNCAYQQNKSIEDVILALTEDIGQLLQNTWVVDGIFFDFSKAFDTIVKKFLLYKLRYYYGLKGKFYNWIKSFLLDRYTRVRLNGTYTKWKHQELGVPQGGPLSALLFIIFVNDFKVVKNWIMRMIKYADDSTLWNYAFNDEKNEKQQNIQEEIDSFTKWAADWKLIVNYSKCEAFCITRKSTHEMSDYFINTNDGKQIKLKKICNKYNRSEEELENEENFEDWFRLLGFDIRCNGKLDKMTSKLNGLCNMRFMDIRRFVNYKALRLNAAATWKLGRQTIHSITEFGSKFWFKEAKLKVKKVFDWQYKLARYCLGARISCPRRVLEFELGFDNYKIRVLSSIIENFEAAKRSPMGYMKGIIFRDWIEYCDFTNYGLVKGWLHWEKTHQNTLMSRGYRLWMDINNIDESNWQIIQPNDVKEVKYSLPIYTVSFPRNISLYYDFDDIIKYINNYDSMNWWTDGSVKGDNHGGIGMVTLQRRKPGKWTSNYGWIDHKTNIDYCELVAIDEVLNEMCNDTDFLDNNNFDYLTILTDSMFCLYQLDEKCYCKFEYYYTILMNIFRKCNFLWQYQKHVRIVKVPAHIGITGNELADFWANTGAETAIELDAIDGCISKNDIPLVVQNEINKVKIKEMVKKEAEAERKAKEETARLKGKKRIGSTLYDPILTTNPKHVLREKKYLSYCESAIIARLRSEHIELNKYCSIIYATGEQTSPYCDYCNIGVKEDKDKVEETVTHFICDCKQFNIERQAMKDEIRCLCDWIVEDDKINIRKLLFPHWAQEKPGKPQSVIERIKILRIVCKYVIKTGRFDNEKIKTNVFRAYGNFKKEKNEINQDCDIINNENLLNIDEIDNINDIRVNDIDDINIRLNKFFENSENMIDDDNG